LKLGRSPIRCPVDPNNEGVDRFPTSPSRKDEASIVGSSSSISVDRLVDHEIAALALDDSCEALDGLEKLDELLIRFLPRKMHAARAQAESDFIVCAPTLITSGVRPVILVPAFVRHWVSQEK
jgi:hypothetical protein